MIDGDAEDARDGSPQEDVEDEAATPAPEEEDEAESPPTITTIPRRRRGRGGLRGRPRIDDRTPEPGGDEGSESGTPFRRRRGRPAGVGSGRGRGGFRGRRKGVQPEQTRVVDENGRALDVVDDEAVVDDDEEGNTKVDEKGNLLGGRDYRVRTFTIIGRDERLYMLSTEPARCCGFRDSYLFFTKHPKLYKVLIGEEEKKDLIDRDILPNSYKGRNIGVVTARSVFREFGARIIVGGRKIVDDYKVTEARLNGDLEGELADPEDRIPENKQDYNRNRYVAWFGASEVYRNVGQSGTGAPGKPGLTGRKRNNITVQNWQHMHAREARYGRASVLKILTDVLLTLCSRFNSAISALRHANMDGVYDTNTNMMFYPKDTQPTHAKWEQIPPPITPAPAKRQQLANGLTNGSNLTNGTAHSDDQETTAEPEQEPRSLEEPKSTIFADIPPIISRNFTITDVVYSAPPLHSAGYPGPDGHVMDLASGPNGLSTVPDDFLDDLPADCRRAFEEAKKAEVQWKRQWGTEAHSALRGDLKIGLNGYPV